MAHETDRSSDGKDEDGAHPRAEHGQPEHGRPEHAAPQRADPLTSLAGVGTHLRALRRERDLTLAAVGARTGISVSTLSRLESGTRRPTLELLLPLAQLYGVTLDDVVAAPPLGDPRIHLRPVHHDGRTMIALSHRPDGIRAMKLILPPGGTPQREELRTHDGYEWFYVLDGRLRVILGHHDLTLGPGEAAEFDTRTPHWFGAVGESPAEVLALFGPQGERTHLRARPRPVQEP